MVSAMIGEEAANSLNKTAFSNDTIKTELMVYHEILENGVDKS